MNVGTVASHRHPNGEEDGDVADGRRPKGCSYRNLKRKRTNEKQTVCGVHNSPGFFAFQSRRRTEIRT